MADTPVVPKSTPPEQSPSPEPSRLAMDTACLALADVHADVKSLCDEFEALLKVPNREIGLIRQSQTKVRAAGMRSVGLTTNYLSELNKYMTLLEAAMLG